METRCREVTSSLQAKDAEVIQLTQSLQSITEERTGLKRELDALNSNYHQLVTDFDAVSEERDSLKASCDRLTADIENLNQRIANLQNEINERDATFADKVKQSEVVLDLQKSLQLAQDEINDKKNVS